MEVAVERLLLEEVVVVGRARSASSSARRMRFECEWSVDSYSSCTAAGSGVAAMMSWDVERCMTAVLAGLEGGVPARISEVPVLAEGPAEVCVLLVPAGEGHTLEDATDMGPAAALPELGRAAPRRPQLLQAAAVDPSAARRPRSWLRGCGVVREGWPWLKAAGGQGLVLP